VKEAKSNPQVLPFLPLVGWMCCESQNFEIPPSPQVSLFVSHSKFFSLCFRVLHEATSKYQSHDVWAFLRKEKMKEALREKVEKGRENTKQERAMNVKG